MFKTVFPRQITITLNKSCKPVFSRLGIFWYFHKTSLNNLAIFFLLRWLWQVRKVRYIYISVCVRATGFTSVAIIFDYIFVIFLTVWYFCFLSSFQLISVVSSKQKIVIFTRIIIHEIWNKYIWFQFRSNIYTSNNDLF